MFEGVQIHPKILDKQRQKKNTKILICEEGWWLNLQLLNYKAIKAIYTNPDISLCLHCFEIKKKIKITVHFSLIQRVKGAGDIFLGISSKKKNPLVFAISFELDISPRR